MAHALLVALTIIASVKAANMELVFDDDFALNTTAIQTDLTTCTIIHSKQTEIMTCTFGKPRTNAAVCTRSQGADDGSPPLRLRINGLANVTYVPESPESMLHIFIARDLYRDHKADLAKMKRAAVGLKHPDSDPAGLARISQEYLYSIEAHIDIAMKIIMIAAGLFVLLVGMANTRHMLTMTSIDQKTFLGKLLKRNDILDQIRECDREKTRLQEQLAAFDFDEDEDDSSTL